MQYVYPKKNLMRHWFKGVCANRGKCVTGLRECVPIGGNVVRQTAVSVGT